MIASDIYGAKLHMKTLLIVIQSHSNQFKEKALKKYKKKYKSTMFLMIHQTGTNCTADGEVFDPIMVGWCSGVQARCGGGGPSACDE